MTKLLAASALSLFSFGAFAADLPARAPSPAPERPAFAWDGLHVGASGGYATNSNTIFVVDADPTYFPDFSGGETMKHKSNSGFGGVEVGYNFQKGRIVYGAFATAVGMDASDRIWSTGGCCGSDDMFTIKLGAIGLLGGRLGYALDRTLIYLDGGFAFANVKLDITDANLNADGSTTNNSTGTKATSKWLPGLVVGAGVDYAISDQWRVGINYRYVNMGSPDWDMRTSSFRSSGEYAGEAPYLVRTRGLDAHLIGLTAKYKFGGSAAVTARY